MILNIIIFLGVLSVLIVAHELGHFTAARLCGVKVPEFGLGLPMGKKLEIFRKKIGETDFVLHALIFGGYVQLHGDDRSGEGDDVEVDMVDLSPDMLASKNRAQRAFIMVAGVLANFVLAFLVIWGTYIYGVMPIMGSAEAESVVFEVSIGEVVAGSVAEVAGLEKGDILVGMDGEMVAGAQDFVGLLTEGEHEIVVRRGEDVETILITKGEGKIGVGLTGVADPVKLGFFDAGVAAGRETWRLTRMTFGALASVGKSLVRASLPSEIAGPVGIFMMTGQAAEVGVTALLQFLAILSVSLGVLNILPIPALDGSHLLVLLGEWLAGGRRLPARVEYQIHRAGFLVLIGFLLVVTGQDILRLFS